MLGSAASNVPKICYEGFVDSGRVRVRESHKTSRSFGYGYGSVNRTSRSSGSCGTCVQNSQKFRAGAKSVVPVPPPGYCDVGRTELT